MKHLKIPKNGYPNTRSSNLNPRCSTKNLKFYQTLTLIGDYEDLSLKTRCCCTTRWRGTPWGTSALTIVRIYGRKSHPHADQHMRVTHRARRGMRTSCSSMHSSTVVGRTASEWWPLRCRAARWGPTRHHCRKCRSPAHQRMRASVAAPAPASPTLVRLTVETEGAKGTNELGFSVTSTFLFEARLT
jgi:hypothetical protein